jgi:GTP-binding protein EngB required for normal cell division
LPFLVSLVAISPLPGKKNGRGTGNNANYLVKSGKLPGKTRSVNFRNVTQGVPGGTCLPE